MGLPAEDEQAYVSCLVDIDGVCIMMKHLGKVKKGTEAEVAAKAESWMWRWTVAGGRADTGGRYRHGQCLARGGHT